MPKRRSIDDDDNDEDDMVIDSRKASHQSSVMLSNLQVLEALQPRVEQRKRIQKNKNGTASSTTTTTTTALPGEPQYQKKKKGAVNALRHRDWIEAQVVEYITKHTPSLQLGNFQNSQTLQQILIAAPSSSSSSSSSSHKHKHALLSKKTKPNDDDDDDNNNNNMDTSEPREQPTVSSSSSLPKIGFGLNEAEALQIINLVPTEPVEIHLILPNVHERRLHTNTNSITTTANTTQYQDELLSTIQSFTKKSKRKTNHSCKK
jgi:hypothetical protein